METDGQTVPKRVAVVGAGVVGLAAAAELRWAGTDVRLYEKAVPGHAQSQGMTRIFYPLRPAYRELPVRCWVDDGKRLGEDCHAYGSPVGTTGSYAVGVSWTRRGAELDAEEVSRETKRLAEWYLGEVLPGLDSQPLAEVRCTYPTCDFAVDGDGFLARHKDHVTAIYGDNLFKFAPLLGAALRDAALTEVLPPALTMLDKKAAGPA